MSNVFKNVSGLRPGRSVFDLSYSKIFDCYAGQLIPIMCDEVVPGDYFSISNEVIVRLQPLVAPMLHAINIYVHYFFVPYRILWTGWEGFITGGVLGNDASVLPRWHPNVTPSKGRLWDMLGFPLVNTAGLDAPLAFPARAYYNIWNEYYRDETLQSAVDIATVADSDHVLKYRDWRKDYFTSALPWTQRGTPPALPVTGTTHAVFNAAEWPYNLKEYFNSEATVLTGDRVSGNDNITINSGANTGVSGGALDVKIPSGFQTKLNNNTVDLSSATTFTVSDLRLSIQVQKWLERNARAGVRYTEFLQEHFGVKPRDDRLQRPEYIGGSKQPLIVSEVLKTSEDGDNPQGYLAGHGLSASMARVAGYKAVEYGLIMGLMSIMPEAVYQSQGFDRQWLRRSKYDFYFREFANLSEQAIEREEIYATTVEADNRTTWGYQGRFDEMRVKRSCVANNMRDTLEYWHMARKFASAPSLNDAFLKLDGTATDMTKPFAVPSEPGYIVHFGNVIKASRPMPVSSDPGQMDHF